MNATDILSGPHIRQSHGKAMIIEPLRFVPMRYAHWNNYARARGIRP